MMNLKINNIIMSGNYFLDGVQNQIKVQKGLKILQFASQYYLSKVYYRNFPVIFALDGQMLKNSKVKSNVLQSHIENAQIMAELNEYVQKHGLGHERRQSKHKQCLDDQSEVDMFADHKELSSSIKRNILKGQQRQKSLSIEVSDKYSLNESDFLSYNSSVSRRSMQMEVIKEVSKDSSFEDKSKVNKLIKNKSTIQNNSIQLSDFDEIREPSQSSSQKDKNFSLNKANFHKKTDPKNEFIQQSSINRHPTDLQIDEIKTCSQDNSNISNVSVVQINLLKQLSSSFIEKDHLKMLIKLQNSEMEKKFIQQKIKKRIEKARQQISKVRNISWASMNVQKPKYEFKQLGYSHIIQ